MTYTTSPPPRTHRRSTLRVMQLGWMSTAAVLAVAWIDHATADVLAHHIHAGYPHYSPARIDSAAAAYIVYLSVTGAVGLVAWIWTIRAVHRNKQWIHLAATLIFAVATSLSLTNLLIKDTSGDTGLPPLLGWVGMLPCLPGLVIVILLWRDRDVTSAH
jgi:hypothetical protein